MSLKAGFAGKAVRSTAILLLPAPCFSSLQDEKSVDTEKQEISIEIAFEI